MPKCTILSCQKRRNMLSNSKLQSNISYHRYPDEPNLKNLWIKATARGPNWIPNRYQTICSNHFEPYLFEKTPNGNRMFLNKIAIPTLNLPANVECMPAEATAEFTPSIREFILFGKSKAVKIYNVSEETTPKSEILFEKSKAAKMYNVSEETSPISSANIQKGMPDNPAYNPDEATTEAYKADETVIKIPSEESEICPIHVSNSTETNTESQIPLHQAKIIIVKQAETIDIQKRRIAQLVLMNSKLTKRNVFLRGTVRRLTERCLAVSKEPSQ